MMPLLMSGVWSPVQRNLTDGGSDVDDSVLEIDSTDATPATPRVLRIGRALQHGPRYWCQPDQWPHHQITIQITVSGCGVLRLDDGTGGMREIAIRRGQALLYDNRRHHGLSYGIADPSVRWSFVYLNLAGGVAEAALADVVARHGHVVGVTEVDDWERRLQGLLPPSGFAQRSWPAAEAAALCHAMFASCCVDVAARAPHMDVHQALAGRAVRMLNERYYEGWSVSRLASELGVSREHLSRVFTRAFQVSPARWLLARRVAHARTMLRGGHKLTEVADACGFGDPATLRHAFRSELGCTPSEYRDGGAT